VKAIRIEPTTAFTLDVFHSAEDAYMADISTDVQATKTSLSIKPGEFMEIELVGYEFTTDNKRYDAVLVSTGMITKSIKPTVFAYQYVTGWCKSGAVKFDDTNDEVKKIDEDTRFIAVSAIVDAIKSLSTGA